MGLEEAVVVVRFILEQPEKVVELEGRVILTLPGEAEAVEQALQEPEILDQPELLAHLELLGFVVALAEVGEVQQIPEREQEEPEGTEDSQVEVLGVAGPRCRGLEDWAALEEEDKS